jgi:hypothetical protein
MPADRSSTVYRELAECYDRQGQTQLRDRFLALAADAALADGQADEAERLRQRLLQQSPHHLLKPYNSFAEARRSPDVQGYLKELRQDYPVDRARGMLDALRAAQEPPKPKAPNTDPELILPVGDEAEGGEPLKVYRMREAREEPARPRPGFPKKPTTPAARPASMLGRSAASHPERPAYSLRPTPPVAPPSAPRRERDSEEHSPASGGWLASLLFVLIAAVGLGLAFYTLARPFLPPEWLP